MPGDWRDRARAQHGAISREQLSSLRIGEDAIDYRIATGALDVSYPGVYLVPGAPHTWEQSLHAVLLGAGPAAAISHLAAGNFWSLEDVACDQPHVLISHGRRVVLPGAIVHRTRRLADDEITTRAGLRVTTPARTLVDLAGMVTRDVLERALDDALRRRIVSLEQVRRCLDRRGPNGVRGWARLNQLVEERVGTEPTGSGKETRFLRGLRKRRMPIPVNQFKIFDEARRFVAQPDFAYPELKIAIEIDSGFHANPRRRRADLRRQNAMSLAGYRVLYFENRDRASQEGAYAAIEAAFGESHPPRSRVDLPKRRKRRKRATRS